MPSEALVLYKRLMREAAKFSGYNFRNYAFRRIRDSFIANRQVTDPARIRDLLSEGRTQLAIIERQGTISQMYASPDLVVEQ